MQWCSLLSTHAEVEQALDEIITGLQAALPQGIDLLLCFVTPDLAAAEPQLGERLKTLSGARRLLGCSAGGVIGGGVEHEDGPALAVTAASLPGVELSLFHVAAGAVPDLQAAPRQWARLAGVLPATDAHFLLLADPFTVDGERLVRGLDAAFPAAVKLGGLASGGASAGEHRLYMNRRVFRGGVVGVALAGDIRFDAVVAQGCRPVGEPLFVTQGDGNVITELDGAPPLEAMEKLFLQSSAEDQALMKHSLFLGVVMEPGRDRYGQGDFLIRNIIGLDPDSGHMAVAAMLPDNAVVQFHLRDAATSRADLEQMLAREREAAAQQPPAGALLFSCTGRGSDLYGDPGHDSALLREHLGPVPVGGFFCNGEIGPVRGETFLHGYTSAIALVRPRGTSGS